MSDESTTDDLQPTEAPELNDLVKVVFLGNSDLREKDGHIKLVDGPSGEPRGLTLGGAKEGDPPDALVTPDELHMLTGKFQIEVVDEQPELTPEEIEAQKPESTTASTGIPVTLPLDDNGNPIDTTSSDGAQDDPQTPPAPVEQPPSPLITETPQPSESANTTPGDGVSAPADQSTPASPPEPISPTPVQ